MFLLLLLCNLSTWHLCILTSGLCQANSIRTNVCNFILLYRIYAGSLFYQKYYTWDIRPVQSLLDGLASQSNKLSFHVHPFIDPAARPYSIASPAPPAPVLYAAHAAALLCMPLLLLLRHLTCCSCSCSARPPRCS
jgi:hypothetical protein